MLATRTPPVLRGLLRGQAWIAIRREPSFVVSQYRTNNPQQNLADHVAAVIKADFVEAFRNSRQGAVTEFRNTASEWGIEFNMLTVPIHFWHGATDTNVPIADVRQFDSSLPDSTLTVNPRSDHIQTLLRSIPRILRTVGE